MCAQQERPDASASRLDHRRNPNNPTMPLSSNKSLLDVSSNSYSSERWLRGGVSSGSCEANSRSARLHRDVLLATRKRSTHKMVNHVSLYRPIIVVPRGNDYSAISAKKRQKPEGNPPAFCQSSSNVVPR